MPYRLLILISILTSGCSVVVNKEFTRPDQTGLKPGVSAEADVIAAEGTPDTEMVTTVRIVSTAAPGFAWAAHGARRYDILSYNFARRNNVDGNTVVQTAEFVLADGRLAGWHYQSSDPNHSTDFDEPAAQAMLSAKTATRSTLVSSLGPPGGLFVYPLTSSPGLTEETWEFVGNDRGTGKRVTKSVKVMFDATGRVATYDARQADTPLPVQAGPVIVPIIVR